MKYLPIDSIAYDGNSFPNKKYVWVTAYFLIKCFTIDAVKVRLGSGTYSSNKVLTHF
jgi:hypothetical protein